MSIVDKCLSICDPTGICAANIDGWRLLKQSDDRFWFCLGETGDGCIAGSPATVISTTVAVPGVWYYVIGVKTSTAISIYVNGAFEATTNLGSFVDTNRTNLLIGRNASEGAFLNGKIDDVALFNKALGRNQIKSLYEQSKREHGYPNCDHDRDSSGREKGCK
jgi:hypothetical protein